MIFLIILDEVRKLNISLSSILTNRLQIKNSYVIIQRNVNKYLRNKWNKSIIIYKTRFLKNCNITPSLFTQALNDYFYSIYDSFFLINLIFTNY